MEEYTQEQQEQIMGALITCFIGGGMSLFWAFDFLFNLHLPFFFGLISVGIFAYGRYLLRKAQSKKEDEDKTKSS